ncbi:unnamed protein product [Effrenium voratum]|uniref:Fe2OG dioxygenase domain-containing protein n=1 Tax=Effrenium voratum TaxID=2562239 RepID=A0AA36J032_9DINO|nr:unnamed protein product [Effrenium voratum]CAJ1446418.1 unnamed protein product [Effrenium voratum]
MWLRLPLDACVRRTHTWRSARTMTRISVVDMAAMADGREGQLRVAQALSKAFADTGFAVVTSTPVPEIALAQLRRSAMDFFHQPLAEKQMVNEGSAPGYGSSPYCRLEENGAQLLGDFTKPDDLVESLTYRPHEGLERLPDRPPELRPAVQEFGERVARFREVLNCACDLALGQDEGFFASKCGKGREALRLAFYPDLEEGATLLDGQMRYGEHVDSFGLTILNLDPANPEGLQVQIGEEWVDVPWVKGSFVLNVGALLSRWTNGYWKAAVHRVLFKRGQRLSIVSGALRPDDDVMLEPCGPGALAGEKFAPVRAGDFCQERVALHRPSYLQQKQLDAEAAQRLSEDIRSYRQ